MDEAFPKARVENLVTTVADDELLVYDTLDHRIHRLNELLALVWRACDGHTTIVELAAEVSRATGQVCSAYEIGFALNELTNLGLVEDWVPRPPLRRSDRRKVAAMFGAGIVSISAPMAAAASSHRNVMCNPFVPCERDDECPPSCPICSNPNRPATHDPNLGDYLCYGHG